MKKIILVHPAGIGDAFEDLILIKSIKKHNIKKPIKILIAFDLSPVSKMQTKNNKIKIEYMIFCRVLKSLKLFSKNPKQIKINPLKYEATIGSSLKKLTTRFLYSSPYPSELVPNVNSIKQSNKTIVNTSSQNMRIFFSLTLENT